MALVRGFERDVGVLMSLLPSVFWETDISLLLCAASGRPCSVNHRNNFRKVRYASLLRSVLYDTDGEDAGWGSLMNRGRGSSLRQSSFHRGCALERSPSDVRSALFAMTDR